MQRVEAMEKDISKALDALSQGIANNMEQLWDNQQELAKSLAEMSDELTVAIEEARNEKAESSRPRLQS